MDLLYIILTIVAVIILFVIFTYNGMITLRNRVQEAWSDIDVQLKRRYNLIPNLVETVKGYATHEEAVLTKVTEARAKAINAGTIEEHGKAETMLSGALKSLFAVAENYPALRANENFLQLQNELVDTEDKIQASRRFYNGTVRDYNTKLEVFPSNMVAGMFHFEKREFFELEDEKEREVVKVSFDKEEKKEMSDPVKTEMPKSEMKAEVMAEKKEMPEAKMEASPAPAEGQEKAEMKKEEKGNEE